MTLNGILQIAVYLAILILLAIGLSEVTFLVVDYLTVTNAAREGARVGAAAADYDAGSIDADDLILNRIAAEKNPAGLIVVTSDQRIAEAARARRIAVRPSAEFARALKPGASAKKTEKESGLSEDEVDEWEKLFNNDH